MTHGYAMRTLIATSAQKWKSLLVHAKFTRIHFFRTIHVPNEVKSAIVLPTIRGECDTHRNCYQKFHNSLLRNIGSRRDDEYRDG